MSSKWLVIGPGGTISLINGECTVPDYDENWAVFKVEANNSGIKINNYISKKDVVYSPAGTNPL